MERGFLSPGRGVKEKSNTAAIKQPTVKSILKKPSVVANKHETTDHNSGNQPSSKHVNVQSFGNKDLKVDELDKMKKVSDQNHNRDDLVPPAQSNEQNLNTTVEPKKVDEQPTNANRTSYLNVVTAETSKVQVNFRSLQSEVSVVEADVTIPLSSVEEVNNRFLNTLYGYFIGKRIAFPVVENYVRNVWSKYGLQKVMMNAKGFFFFKFSTNKGMNDALENGPWMIRTSPIILNQWTPNISLAKEDLSKVPVWVKLHDVPMAAFTADGLSMIATMLGTPMRLDSYTATMCQESWGRSSFARALIEIHSNQPLKDVIVVAIPNLDGSGYTKENVRVEYEWKPPRCDVCALFGHYTNQCPSSSVQKNPSDGFVEVGSKGSKVNKEGQTARKVQGVSLGKQKSNFVYRPKVATNKEKPKQKEDTHVSTSNPFSVLSGSDYKMDDVIREVETSKRDGKAVHGSKETVPKETVSKVDNLADDESDIEEVYNETSYFMASGLGSGTGGGGPSNLEFFDEDDFYDDYRDQVYDLTEEQENFCNAFDINLRGQIKKKK